MANLTLLDFTDEELDALSEITDQDTLAALQSIQSKVSDRSKNVPLAEIEINDAEFAE